MSPGLLGLEINLSESRQHFKILREKLQSLESGRTKMRKILCILVYDQECMVRNNNDNNNCDEQSSSYSSFIIMRVTFTTLQKSNEASCIISENIINIDWFNTLLNYSLIILNSIMVLSLMRVINKNYNNEDFGKQELQQSVHGCGTEIPSHLSTRLCFAFGKRLFACKVCICIWHDMLYLIIIVYLFLPTIQINYGDNLYIKIYKSFYFSDSTLPCSEMYWCINRMVCNIGMVNNYGSDVDEN